jgi:serine/threonine-protein kinase
MSLVYKAFDVIEKKVVVVKILKDEFHGNVEFLRRFKTESKAVAVLSHPNIVKIFNVSFGNKLQYIVMEYVEGLTLKQFFESNGRKINISQAILLVKQILSAVGHAHANGIIHRDVKPQNIMILEDGTVKVTDFGIARFLKNETQTMTDRTIGSVHYISPEQVKGNAIDTKSDIYSIGIIIYEMLTGQLPFEAENAVSVAIMQMQMNPKFPREVNASIPEALEEIILKAMKKNVSERYQSTGEMLADLEAFEKNSNIKFNYKYFVDKNPTKIIEMPNLEKTVKKPEDQNKKKAVLIASSIAAVVVLFSLTFMFMTVFTSFGSAALRDVEVPNLLGLRLIDIEFDKKYKFHWNIDHVYDPSKPEGIVLDQDPVPGSKKIKSSSTITLKVNSSGVLVDVPALAGLTVEAAKNQLSNAGLKCEILQVHDENIPAGIVKGSDPVEGIKTMVESTIALYVSKGPLDPTVAVPNVIGMNISDAKQEILKNGLKFSNDITYEKSENPKDTIISTDPLPGVSLDLGGTVKATVSSGVRKEKTLDVVVDLPKIDKDIDLNFYIDGTFEKKFKVDPGAIREKVYQIKGTQGTKEVRVKIGEYLYRTYRVDFEGTGSVIVTGRYGYPPNPLGFFN